MLKPLSCDEYLNSDAFLIAAMRLETVASDVVNNVETNLPRHPDNEQEDVAGNEPATPQKYEYQIKQLRQKYPVKYVLVHSSILIVSAIIVICVQIGMVICKTQLYMAISGFWVGAFVFICAALALVIIKIRSIYVLLVTIGFHLFAVIVSIGGLIVINSVAYSSYNSVTHSGHTTVDPSSQKSSEYSGLHIPMFIFGIVCSAAALAYSIAMFCLISGKACFNQKQHVSNFHLNNNNNLQTVSSSVTDLPR